MITIEQTPQGFMGSNMDHYFTLSSTNTSLPNFKYVVDVWFNPYETTAEKIGRVKVRPNTYGKGIINVRDIIKNYIQPNPRSENQYFAIQTLTDTWYKNATPNPNGNISFATGFTESNVHNGTNPYPILNHTGSYRIIVGEEYTSGSTTILNIQTNYWVPTDVANITESLDTAIGPPYAGTPNRINWSGMNSWDFGTNYGVFTSGYTYQHYNVSGGLIASGTSVNDSGNYIAALEPSRNDVFYVWSNDLGCGFEFVWNCDICETNGWNYVGTYSPYPTPICSSASDLVRLTPAAAPDTYMWSFGDAINFDSVGTTPFSNTEYMANFRLSSSQPYPELYGDSYFANFYNKFGSNLKSFETSGITISATEKQFNFRYRQHHKDCPIIFNFANGNLGNFQYQNLNHANQVSGVVELRQTGNTLNYYANHINPNSGTTSNIYTSLDGLVTNFTKFYWGQADFEDLKKVAFYTYRSGTPSSYSSRGTSNIYVYEFYGDECLYGDAVHFMYLNTNGAWDTITFAQKNIKSVSTSRDVYAQSGIRDASSYMWGSYEQRNITYNQDTIVSVEAQSAWVDENDVPNFRDFFLSNYVYQIVQSLDGSNYLLTTLIPITITDNTFEEYKQRYNKLYQYSMNYTYNTINQFNTSL